MPGLPAMQPQHAPARSPASWLQLLTSSNEFFKPCSGEHPLKVNHRDTLLTFLDLETCTTACHYCRVHLPSNHRVLQIRRSTYHEVVKVAEIAPLTDVSGVQSYVINSDKVMFLRPRPQPRPPKGCSFPAVCKVCNRHLMDSGNLYCSLRCKLDWETEHTESAGAAAVPQPSMVKVMASKKRKVIEYDSDTKENDTPLRWAKQMKRTGFSVMDAILQKEHASGSRQETSYAESSHSYSSHTAVHQDLSELDSPYSWARPLIRQRKHTPRRAPLQ